ncbi:MAG TPA: sensor domain-containing protein [Streptosporangiaceae bacterium]
MRVRAAFVAGGYGLAFALLSQFGSLVLLTLATNALSLMSVGIGLILFPLVIVPVRGYANFRRGLARDWSGVEIPEPYLPRPQFRSGFDGWLQRFQWVLMDKATWRDMLWLLVDGTAGFVLAILPVALIAYFPYGLVLAFGVWRPIYDSDGGEWFTFIHVTSQTTAWYAAALGAVYLLVGLAVSPALIRAHGKLTRAFLAPTRERELAQRVAHLSETRSDALDTQAAELRRIERDLHDGAQARLVAMGMSLGAIEHLLERDPERAKLLLAEARESSSKALSELRDLVRGIHPPVLAERGLDGAVRALALNLRVPTSVDSSVTERLSTPVESAAYFAIAEALTNVTMHSGATFAYVSIRRSGDLLQMEVGDDGKGGADPGGGTGLCGIERRLAAFDGTMALSSPPGGPTIVTMELPCALSSPRTMLSSGTD